MLWEIAKPPRQISRIPHLSLKDIPKSHYRTRILYALKEKGPMNTDELASLLELKTEEIMPFLEELRDKQVMSIGDNKFDLYPNVRTLIDYDGCARL